MFQRNNYVIHCSFFLYMQIGLPAVVTLSAPIGDTLVDGIKIVDCCKQLEEGGAAVVGLNCGRGPETMIPLLKDIRKACKVSFKQYTDYTNLILIPFCKKR